MLSEDFFYCSKSTDNHFHWLALSHWTEMMFSVHFLNTTCHFINLCHVLHTLAFCRLKYSKPFSFFLQGERFNLLIILVFHFYIPCSSKIYVFSRCDGHKYVEYAYITKQQCWQGFFFLLISSLIISTIKFTFF